MPHSCATASASTSCGPHSPARVCHRPAPTAACKRRVGHVRLEHAAPTAASSRQQCVQYVAGIATRAAAPPHQPPLLKQISTAGIRHHATTAMVAGDRLTRTHPEPILSRPCEVF
jgi:hypothetical protein